MMIKQYLQKQILKVEVVSDLSGRLRLKLIHYKTIPKEALEYIEYIEQAIQMLGGIDSVQFNTTIGTILINYNVNKVSKNDISKWLDIIIQTGIDSAELIEKHGETNKDYLRQIIEEKLKKHLQEMW